MSSEFSVTTPATDLTLLAIGELRAAVGVTDQTRDVELKILGKRVSDRITQACRVKADGATPPTLRKESLSETFRMPARYDYHRHQPQELILARFPIVTVTSVTEDGTALTASDYKLLGKSGMLLRLSSDGHSRPWCGSITTIAYDAGWATVPESLKMAAEQLARAYWFQNSRDPALRQISVPGVIEKQFWVGASGDPDIPQNVMDMLSPYMNPAIG
jgi:hypothetical protein